MSYQLPAWSPVSLGALAAGVAPPRNAVARLAEQVRSEYGARKVALTGSGTDALAICLLAAAPAGRRPRVALPAWGCYDLMTAADIADAQVTLYDLIPETLGPDPDSLRAALAAEPDAVVVAHWFGLPVDLGEIIPLARSLGAVVIDDAAQGVGASIHGRPAGAGGEYGVLSFGRGKGRTGGAGGAALAFSDGAAEALARAETRLRMPGAGVGSVIALAAQWALGRPSLYGIPSRLPGLRLGETLYHPAGEPTRMAGRNAAIVSSVWAASSREADIRRANALRWRAALADVTNLHSYTVTPGAIAGWLRYPVLTSTPIRDVLQRSAARRHGAMPGYPGVLTDLPVGIGRWGGAPLNPSGARRLAENLFTLPTHSRLRDSDMARIGRWVRAE